MKVKDLILYQISTDRYYKVGDKLEFGKEYNFQGQRVLNGAKLNKKRTYDDGYAFVDSKKIFANKKVKKRFPLNLIFNLIYYIIYKMKNFGRLLWNLFVTV